MIYNLIKIKNYIGETTIIVRIIFFFHKTLIAFFFLVVSDLEMNNEKYCLTEEMSVLSLDICCYLI